jgi:hypothetical protein
MDRDRQFASSLLLDDSDFSIADICPSHAVDIAASLPREKKEREGFWQTWLEINGLSRYQPRSKFNVI